MLAACYDLARNPPTYDFVTFLMVAERERLLRGDDSIAIEILPGPAGGFRRDDLWPHSVDDRRALLARIVVPMARMLPSCTSVTDYKMRPESARGFGVGRHMISSKHFIEAMSRGIRPLRAPGEVEKDDTLITLTLREADHWPERNSKLEEWLTAARHFKACGFRVVIVRDTLRAFDAIDGLEISTDASVDLRARARLYRSAACNVFVNNGPAWLAMALDAPMLMMRPGTEGSHKFATAEAWAAKGVEIGGQIPGAPPYQRLIWRDDYYQSIIGAVRDFL